MLVQCPLKTYALLLAISAAFALTCAAAESVPYDLSQETYKTETLFSYDGCVNHHLMGNSGQPKVFKNNVYVPIIVYGLHPRILQVPLDGGDAKIGHLEPDFYIGEDSHRYFTLGVDKKGYIHVVGGMHGGPWRYWISAKPEDVSKFLRAAPEQNPNESNIKPEDISKVGPAVIGLQAPPGYGITYPHFSTDAAGNLFLHSRGSTPDFRKSGEDKIVHIGLLSTYDAALRKWRLLGADIPKVFGGHPGHPVTLWGDCFENGAAGGGWYIVNTAGFVASPDNTLHFVFHILNYASPTENLRNIITRHAPSKDILYAWSKDGGRTLQRADGSKVQWPVCAKAGPYQPDVIYSANADYAAMEKAGDGKFPGLVGGQIQLDWKNRPMIRTHNNKTDEDVVFRLENGKWGSCPAKAFGRWRDNAGVLISPTGKRSGELVRLWDERHSRILNLGNEIEKLDADYFRDTGTMIYTTKNPKEGNKVINVMRTTIQRPANPKSN